MNAISAGSNKRWRNPRDEKHNRWTHIELLSLLHALANKNPVRLLDAPGVLDETIYRAQRKPVPAAPLMLSSS
jgi:hypothetical protein